MNKRQRKKDAKKKEQAEVGAAIRELWEFVPKGDEPCDDPKCESCYVQPVTLSYFK